MVSEEEEVADPGNYFGFKSKEQEEREAEPAKDAYKAMLQE